MLRDHRVERTRREERGIGQVGRGMNIQGEEKEGRITRRFYLSKGDFNYRA